MTQLKPSSIFKYIFLSSVFLFFISGFDNGAKAQGTGSHVFSSSSPLSTIRFTEPGEITEIRILLEHRLATKAIDKARRYLRTFELSKINWGENPYYALNALCSALTMNGELEEALESCTRAVEEKPNHWQAINNRGTTHFVAGRYQDAMKDYRRALELKPDDGNFTRVIQHNIALAEARLGDD